MSLFKFIFALSFSFLIRVQNAGAVPVMNENASAVRTVTIFPDHWDPRTYYIAPNSLSICLDPRHVPRFSFQDIAMKSGLQSLVQIAICPRFMDAELEMAKAQIHILNPLARFVALPYTSSKMVFDPVYSLFIVKEFCTHPAGMVGDEQACSFRLNTQGRRIFLKHIRDRLTMVHQYEYTVSAFIRKPVGGFDAQISTYGIAVRIGGEELSDHPELFSDIDGNPLKFR